MFRGSVGPPWPTGFTSLFAHHIVERLPLADALITAAEDAISFLKCSSAPSSVI